MASVLESAGPKVLRKRGSEAPVVVFTDGACEPGGTSIGGVILIDGRCETFGAMLPQSLVDSWKTRLNQEQVIGQAELYPLLIARLTWARYLANRKVVYFVDNESARLAMVKSYSPVLPSLQIIVDTLGWDHKNNSIAWFARVPTQSNIADEPSRLTVGASLLALGAEVVRPVFPTGVAPDVFL